ncbi:anthranilate synthase component II [Pontibacillus salicampi]|uniref:Anthranilate synthase component II n=1 Tax=Pontibacillus salicampi TaxID=1449801 RepID=A0ABV6LKV3_9BACI
MIIIIDNYDSFTYNLVQYIDQIADEVVVYKNDQITTEEVIALRPDAIVLSPGPGSPQDTGVSREVLSACYLDIPILGVCLGYQLIVDFFGGRIEKGPLPVHGKVFSIVHDGQTMFKDIALPTPVTRYHSLMANRDSIPDCLEVSAETEDGVIMAVRHTSLPIEGVQFHPESITSIDGFSMLKNYFYHHVNSFRYRQKEGTNS